MKKYFVVLISIISILSLCICLSACQPSDKYFLPVVVSEIEGLTVEHVNNINESYAFPVGTEKLSHEKFKNEGIIESAYLLKDKEGEVVGWITSNFASYSKGDKYEYGYKADKSNGQKLHFENNNIWIYLLNQESSAFENLTVTANYGVLSWDSSTVVLDEENQDTGCVCGFYYYTLSDVDPNNVDVIKITLSLNNK